MKHPTLISEKWEDGEGHGEWGEYLNPNPYTQPGSETKQSSSPSPYLIFYLYILLICEVLIAEFRCKGET